MRRPRTRETSPLLTLFNGGGGVVLDSLALATRLVDTYGAAEVWRLNESEGTTALASVSSDRNGTYSAGVQLANAAGPGVLAKESFPFFSDDYLDLYTASLAALFDPDEYAWWVLFKTDWVDNAQWIVSLRQTSSNYSQVIVSPANTLVWYHTGNGTVKSTTKGSVVDTDWISLALRTSITGDAAQPFYNGTPEGAALTGLAQWTGTIAATSTCLGAATTVPQNMATAHIALFALWVGAGNLPSDANIASIESDLRNGWTP